jgi:hypothetical protein
VIDSAKTNNSGMYLVPILPPCHYHVQVSKPGFSTIIKADVVLNVQSAVALNFVLPVGSTSESLTVDASSPVMNTTDATVSTVVDRSRAIKTRGLKRIGIIGTSTVMETRFYGRIASAEIVPSGYGCPWPPDARSPHPASDLQDSGFSSMRRNRNTVVSSGAGATPRSTPTNLRNAADSYSASSTLGSDRLNLLHEVHPEHERQPHRLPSLACLGIVRTHQTFQSRLVPSLLRRSMRIRQIQYKENWPDGILQLFLWNRARSMNGESRIPS